jgi:hypothetical protein
VLKDLQAHKGSKVLKVVEEPQERRVLKVQQVIMGHQEPQVAVEVQELKELKELKEPQDQQGLQIVD